MGAGVSKTGDRSQIVVPKQALSVTEVRGERSNQHELSSAGFGDSFELPPPDSGQRANQAAIYTPVAHFAVSGGTSISSGGTGANSTVLSNASGDMCQIGSTKPSEIDMRTGSHGGLHVGFSGHASNDTQRPFHHNSRGTQTDMGTGMASTSYTPEKPSSWTKGDSLGSGSFGSVFLALNDDTGTLTMHEVYLRAVFFP